MTFEGHTEFQLTDMLGHVFQVREYHMHGTGEMGK